MIDSPGPLQSPLFTHSEFVGQLRVGTINLQSKGNSSLSSILKLITNLNIHILCMQDLGKMNFNSFSIYFKHYNFYQFSTQLGEAETWGFFISKSLSAQIKISPPIHSVKARCSFISLIFPEHTLNIVNTYAPPSEKRAEYSCQLAEFLKINKLTFENTMLLGDMNDYLDSSLDRWCNVPIRSAHKLRGDILRPLINKKFVDAFRHFNPDKRAYTRFGFQNNLLQQVDKIICTRIDHILIGKKLLPNVCGTNIFEEQLIDSDHRLCTIDLQMSFQVQNIPLPTATPFIRKFPNLGKKSSEQIKKLWKENFGQVVAELLQTSLLQPERVFQNTQEIDDSALLFTTCLHNSVEKVFGWADEFNKNASRKPIVGNSEYGQLKKLRNMCRSLHYQLISGLQNEAIHITLGYQQEKINEINLKLATLLQWEGLFALNSTPTSQILKLTNYISNLTSKMVKIKIQMKKEIISGKIDKIIEHIDSEYGQLNLDYSALDKKSDVCYLAFKEILGCRSI